MIPVQTLKITNFAGGANEKLSPLLIAENQSARQDSSTLPLVNCHTNINGKLIKRSGNTVFTAPIVISGSPDITLTNIIGIYEYVRFSGVKLAVVVADDGTDVYVIDISTPSAPIDITGETNFTIGCKVDFCVVADKLIITSDLYDQPVVWDGTGGCEILKLTIAGSPDTYEYAIQGKFCEEFQNFGIIGNTSANPERVYWSGLFDPYTWVLTDFKRLNDACTGIAKRGDSMFLFTRNSITLCQYTGDSVSPFQFNLLDTSIGCVSNRTLKNIEGVLFWLGGDGHIYRMAGFKPERLTEAIPVTIASLNVDGFDIACAEDHKELRQYWCAVTNDSSTVNDFVIAYDYFGNEIFLYDGMNISAIGNFSDSQGQIKTYFGDDSGYIYLTNNGGADYPLGVSTAINYWKFSKEFDLGNPATVKRIRRIKINANNDGNYTSSVEVWGDAGSVGGTAVSISHNGGGDLLGSTWILGTSRLGRSSMVHSQKDLAFNAKTIQLKFSGDGINQPVEIKDVEVMFQEYDQDRYK